MPTYVVEFLLGRYCAEQSWEQSDAQLRQKVGKRLMEQWHEATKEFRRRASP